LSTKKTFVFSQTEEFHQQLEIKHIRQKNHYVLGIVLFLMILFVVYMILSGFTFLDQLPVLFGFFAVLIFNIANLAYGQQLPEFFHINKYFTTIGIFSVAILIVFQFQSPSMMIVLFIAYAISAFYQDTKVLMISDVMLLVTVLLIIVNYPAFLGLADAPLESRFGIGFFFVTFVIMLSISNYIIIKQKSFFFHQISTSHEHEFRNLDLLIDLKKQLNEKQESIEYYFDALMEFTNAFSEKLETENAFTKKINVLRELSKNVNKESIIARNPEFTMKDLDRLEDLLVFGHHKLRKVAIKISTDHHMVIERREIFSETQFKSFNHQSDNIEIKIVAFVLFYAALKKGYGILPGLKEEQIFNELTKTDFYYYLEPQITKIYENNSEVFDQIVKDAFGKKVSK